MNKMMLAAAALLALGATPSLAHKGSAKLCPALIAVDPDNDGKLDLDEAKKAALKTFRALDPDKDGTLDRRELRGRIGLFEMMRANPDRDGTLDKAEYLAVVAARFKAANRDGDTTLECDELESLRGRRLMRLLK